MDRDDRIRCRARIADANFFGDTRGISFSFVFAGEICHAFARFRATSFSVAYAKRTHQLRTAATRIITAEGFTVNVEKTRAATQSSRQTVTGVVVNKALGLSRQERRRLRAMAHHLRREQTASNAAPEKLAELRGHLAYLSMLNPAQAKKLKWLD